MALLLEEPFAYFGKFNPTGHAAVYLSRVCAASPVTLRRCEGDEAGVVISRYDKVGGYDWIAIPLFPYLYAVDTPAEIPAKADMRTVALLRDRYRRTHLREIVPDGDDGRMPEGNWIQLVGSSYDRRIYVLEMDTSPDQDERLIRDFNAAANKSSFNLFFSNCAGFSSTVIKAYYRHAVSRSYVFDLGLATPKQLARSMIRYGQHHPESGYRAWVIPQVPGLPRSRPIRGVIESFFDGPEYTLPAAAVAVHPLVLCSAAVVYLAGLHFHGREHFPGDIGVTLVPEEIARKLAFDNRALVSDAGRPSPTAGPETSPAGGGAPQ